MPKPVILPPFVEPGDLALVVSPSRRLYPAELNSFTQTLRDWGWRTQTGKFIYSAWHQQAGTDEQRAADMQWALDHPEAKVIFASRGGYGVTRILDRLDWSGFLERPKWLVGFSDFTPMLATAVGLGVAAVHGIVPRLFGQAGNEQALGSLYALLRGMPLSYGWVPPRVYNVQGDFSLTGQLFGGNLAMLANSIGTDTEVSANGRILLLEDVGEAHYAIDRMMVQLTRAGILNGVQAVLVGQFTELRDQATDFGLDVPALIAQHVPGVPVLAGFPIGHVPDNRAVPLGCMAHLSMARAQASLYLPDFPAQVFES